MTLCSLFLLWQVKFDKLQDNFFVIKIWFYTHDIIQPSSTFQGEHYQTRIYCNLMKIEFYLNQSIDDKRILATEVR